jgi:hypothetical protein
LGAAQAFRSLKSETPGSSSTIWWSRALCTEWSEAGDRWKRCQHKVTTKATRQHG